MHSFKNFLQTLSESTGMDFKIVDDEKNEIFTSSSKKEINETISVNVSLGKTQAYVHISKEYEKCTALIKYMIESKYNEFLSTRQEVLNSILGGMEVPRDLVRKNLHILANGCTVFIVNVEGSRYEALNIIGQLYDDEITSIIYGDNIVVIGQFEDNYEHASSIKETIMSNLYCKCYVSFGDICYDAETLKKSYEKSKEAMCLGKIFEIKDEVYSYENMIFEKIVYSVEEKVKNELVGIFKHKFDNFDNEMITTIEEFVNCGLNISDAAKVLYIHRNTLIYRLDKITKETGFDIRNFKEATVFIVAFLIWKENKKK